MNNKSYNDLNNEIQNDLVSIVIPVHNAELFIYDTMEMVRCQSYENWELIMVDDGSHDGSVGIIKKYMEDFPDLCISLIEIPVATSAADARNRGLNASTGRYICFLDADDIWKPEKLSRELEFLKGLQEGHGGTDHPKPGFAFTAYEFADEEGVPLGKVAHVPEQLSYKKALSRTVIFTSTVLFDTTVIPKELIRMPEIPSEDTATWWQILRTGHTAYGLDEVLVYYRRHGGSLSSNKLVAIKRIWKLYRERERLGIVSSCFCFAGWAVRATLRRL